MIIHNIGEYQDIRKMGIGSTNLRLAGSVIIIANLSLSGFPFLRGFYSKDLILEIMIIGGQGPLIIFILSVGTFLTVFYSCRIRFFIPSWIKILVLIIIRLAIAVYYISFCKNNPSSKYSIYAVGFQTSCFPNKPKKVLNI